VTSAQLQRYSSMDGQDMLDLMLPSVPRADKKQLLEAQGANYRRDYLRQAKPFPGVRDLFVTLKRTGFALGIATSCKQDELGYYDKAMGILCLVDAIACGDDARRGKPHPDLYAVAVQKLNVKEASTCMAVGDSPYDAQAARTAGLDAAGVLTGGFSRGELIRKGCRLVLERAIDLPRHLTRLK
jgi:HAD superfamily hydrolase (TIGR01509 family)